MSQKDLTISDMQELQRELQENFKDKLGYTKTRRCQLTSIIYDRRNGRMYIYNKEKGN